MRILQQGAISQFRCLIGHSFSPENLTEAHREALERALLTSLRMLRERSRIHQALASEPPRQEQSMRPRHAEAAVAAEHNAALLQEILERI